MDKHMGKIVMFIFLAFWSFLTFKGILPPFLVASPLEIINVFLYESSLLIPNAFTTFLELFIGLFVGILAAFFMASLCSFLPIIEKVLRPIITLMQSLPSFILMPLLLLWFGFGLLPKIFLVAFSVFFPIILSLLNSFSRLSYSMKSLIHLYRPQKWQLFWYFQVPSALPSFFSGLEIACLQAPVTLVASEWLGAQKGIGYLILLSYGRLNIPMLYACVIVLILMSFFYLNLVRRVKQKVLFWHE